MESYQFIWVRDARSRPVQISIPKVRIRQAAIAVAVLCVIGLAGFWDYWRLRADNAELAGLRVEALEQFRARLGQGDAPRGAVQQPDAEPLFESPDRFAEGRGRAPKPRDLSCQADEVPPPISFR